jgi:hypothetical protein
MKALFWLLPSILHLGKKGQMIRKTRKELGGLATDILKDAEAVSDPNSKTLMSLMRTILNYSRIITSLTQ